MSFSRGFSLLELLIVTAIMVTLLVAGSGFYRGFGKNVELGSVSQTIQADLRQAQSYAMIGQGGYKWGIRFVKNASGSDYYYIFSTDGINSTTTATTTLSSGITFSDPSSGYKDVIFSKIAGAPVVPGPPTFSATGGIISYTDSSGLNPRSSPAYTGGYTVYTFTASSIFQVTAGSANVDYLVVAGGGGAGAGGGGNDVGGGGAGGFRTGTLSAMTTGSFTVTVGGGGGFGVDSAFSTITSTGGGPGGTGTVGYAGGSGGGGADFAYAGGAGNTPATTPSQGNNGGAGGAGSSGAGGGGGGAGSAGTAGVGSTPGVGGNGVASSISGTSVTYSSGGNGAPWSATAGTNGSANTGNGGAAIGGTGGSGIVILRYLLTLATDLASATTTAITLEGVTATTTISAAGAIY